MKKVTLTAVVRLNAYKIIDETVENAVRYGHSRAYKHTDEPSEEAIIEEIHRAVMNNLSDVLSFGDED